jgi:hypothetical protein
MIRTIYCTILLNYFIKNDDELPEGSKRLKRHWYELQVTMTIFMKMEYLFVGGVMPLFIRLNVSLMLVVDGQVSMITFQMQ